MNRGNSPTGGESGGLSGDKFHCNTCQGKRNHAADTCVLINRRDYLFATVQRLAPDLMLKSCSANPVQLTKDLAELGGL